MALSRYPKDVQKRLPDGYRVVLEGRGSNHPRIVSPDGTTLRNQFGVPVKISLTPSGGQSLTRETSIVLKAIRARESQAE